MIHVPLKRLTANRARCYLVTPGDCWRPVTRWTRNDLIVDAAVIMQKLLRNDRTGNWHVGGMFLEFDNSGSAVDPVPTINVEDGLAYYESLGSSPNRDYLRVPLLGTSESSSDQDKYPGGNVAEFIAQTAGSVGVHGKAFTAGLSRIYGGALVALVDANDSSRDLIWSRLYFDPSDQVVKPVGSQIGVTWEYTFTES